VTETAKTKWTKTGEWSQYATTLADGTTITVSKYFPGENWWVGQNFYWAWQIETRTEFITPGGEYQRTLKECKADALRYWEAK
jgi:hypothetical protein